jgi:hypothetical protein
LIRKLRLIEIIGAPTPRLVDGRMIQVMQRLQSGEKVGSLFIDRAPAGT